jgi:hypothetical protein
LSTGFNRAYSRGSDAGIEAVVESLRAVFGAAALDAAVVVPLRGLLAARGVSVRAGAGSADVFAGSTLARAGFLHDIFSVIDGPTATPNANTPINAAVSAVAFPAVIVEPP